MEALFEKYRKSIEKRGITFEKDGDILNFYSENINLSLRCSDDGKLESQHNTLIEHQVINLINKSQNKKKYTKLFDKINDYHVEYVKFTNHRKLLKLIIDFVPIVKEFCVSCGEKLPYPSNNFMSCEHDLCRYKLDELNTGDDIVNMYQERPNILRLLLETALTSVKSDRRTSIFEPFPPKYLVNNKEFIKRGELSLLNGTELYKQFAPIDTLLHNKTIKSIMNDISKASSDAELAENIGDELYYLIKFMVKSNKTDLKEVKLFNNSDDYHINQFSIIHSPEVEEKFKTHTKNKTNYLFHGSSFENWYSILCNGIKIMSNTKLMVNAAAHGAGIYLSDSFAFSCEYSDRRRVSDNIIVAVFEINGNKSQYKKTHNIYTINNNDDLLLRYLLVLPRKNYRTYDKSVSQYFGIKAEIEKTKSQSRISARAVKRIMKEYKDSLNNKISGIRIETSEDNLSKWSVYFSDFGDCDLQKDMDKFKIDEIELEVQFPDMYPLHPPFFRVIRPVFCYQTGRITSGGSICVDTLTLEAWSAATRMESLLLMIKTLFVEGEGRIDPAQLGNYYNLKKAKESFQRVAKQHGWKIM